VNLLGETFLSANPRGNLIDSIQETIEFRLTEEILDDDKAAFVETTPLLLCHGQIVARYGD
jgi:hypothetical protein